MPMPHIRDAPENSDKVVHILVYSFFTGLWFCYFYVLKLKKDNFSTSLIKSCGLAFVDGIMIEILQELLTTSRSGDFKDLIANSIGILVGVLFIFLAKTQFRRLKSKF